MLAKRRIKWESREHLLFVDRLFERISQAAIEASADLGKEKGSYPLFEGSGWQTGTYFPDGAIREADGNRLPQRQPRECGMHIF